MSVLGARGGMSTNITGLKRCDAFKLWNKHALERIETIGEFLGSTSTSGFYTFPAITNKTKALPFKMK